MTSRKISLILSMLIVLIFAWITSSKAQVFYPSNQKTLSWDAVTTLITDTGEVQIPEENVVKYRVYIAPYDEVTNGPGEAIEVGVTEETQYTITFGSEGKYLLGVRSERYLNADETEPVSTSEISWSNVEYQSESFGVIFYYPLKAPSSLR